MDIGGVMRVMQWVHDEEDWDLGSFSTRDDRNEFIERVVGIIYHGHPFYNQDGADTQWHLKAARGRPQSDDVVVSMPSREAWDCIPGAGADDYYFNEHYIGELPDDQDVYPPPVPFHNPNPEGPGQGPGEGEGGGGDDGEGNIDIPLPNPDDVWPPGARPPQLRDRDNLYPRVNKAIAEALAASMSANASGETKFLRPSVIKRTAVGTGNAMQAVVDYSSQFPPKRMQGALINPLQPDNLTVRDVELMPDDEGMEAIADANHGTLR
jgi:hypothetical protein